MDFDRELELERIKADPQEALAFDVCNDCGAEIYKGNECFITEDGYTLCEECMDKYLEEIKDNARQIAGDE